MAADRQRLAAALAYRQAEEERRRRMMESVPGLVTTPAQPAPRADFRTNLENFSIGLGEGLTNQLEGVKGIITDPVGTAKRVYEAGRAVIRDPSVIADALRYTAQKATSGPLGAGEVIGEMIGPRKGGPMMQELDVYHGTPHRFPATEANPLGEFDASKIGTGEGAQAYGHGIYYAENPEVAKGYQPRDPKAEAKLMNLYKQAEARENYDAMEVLEAAMLHRTASELAEQFPQQKALINRIGKINEKAAGALYKADLPDEMIDRMLDWDKPIKDQPTVLQSIRATLPDDVKKDFDANVQGGISGGNAYLNWVWGAKSAAQKSDKLKEAGIPGIKYSDAGSRGQGGSGTRNFVVFPGEEKKVRILERDGKKVAEMLQRTAPASAEVEVDLYPLRGDSNTLYLSKIAVPEGQRGQGLGTKAMQDVIARADAEGKRVVLSPSTEYGATSVGRLKDFYKRFGFVENKGRNKNYAVSQTMYRDPLERDGQKAPPQKIAQALEAAPSKAAKAEPQPFGVQGYLNDDLRRVKQNFFSQYGVEENKQFSKDYEVVELAKLKPSENINESKIQSLMKTMREEGNARDNPIPPIIVDSEGNILDGHHRYEAAKRLGAKYVPIVELFDKRKGPVFSE